MSRTINVTIPHQLGQAQARQRIDQGFGQLQNQIASVGLVSVKREWAGDVLSFSASVVGQSVSGSLRVFPERVEIAIDLPDVLAMLAGVIKGRLRKEGQLLLTKR